MPGASRPRPSVRVEAEPGLRLPRGTAAHLGRCVPLVAEAWTRPPDIRSFTVRYLSDTSIRLLNARFKHRDTATDVLAFVTGDVAVSYETGRRQALEMGHSFRRELVHLAVHGLLHLGGWEDRTPALRGRMERRTVAILEAAGVR